jgi:hypothetical protein
MSGPTLARAIFRLLEDGVTPHQRRQEAITRQLSNTVMAVEGRGIVKEMLHPATAAAGSAVYATSVVCEAEKKVFSA